MNAEQTELFRIAILRVLDANRTRYGIGIVAMGHHLNLFGFNIAMFKGEVQAFHDAIADALQYLCDKGLVEEALKVVSKENRAWRIASAGIAYIDQRG